MSCLEVVMTNSTTGRITDVCRFISTILAEKSTWFEAGVILFLSIPFYLYENYVNSSLLIFPLAYDETATYGTPLEISHIDWLI